MYINIFASYMDKYNDTKSQNEMKKIKFIILIIISEFWFFFNKTEAACNYDVIQMLLASHK